MRVPLGGVGWDALSLVDAVDDRPLIERRAVLRGGFYEMQARTVIERLPVTAGVSQQWGVSPYRGCAHACRGCGARGGHRRLGLDAGRDFDTRIVVRPNVAERLRAELPRWEGESLAVGAGGDCYQEAEATYRLMPGVVRALGEAGVPFTVYTKSPLVLRDAPLLARAGARVAVSIAFVDERIRRAVEPGAVGAQARLELVSALVEAGVECRVLMAPVLPLLSDAADQLAATVRRIAAAGAGAVEPVVLRLPAGTRSWYLEWLGQAHPGLVARYEELYDAAGLPSPEYERRITGQIEQLCRVYGMACGAGEPVGRRRGGGEQLALV
ncbi:Rv2578c family radical SAM protein [Nonomuraea roseoviolacea subsp. roseoviolacea]|uniref:DNA repair photolyase n=1 Tax=Nonomuraea roseoviolacea subsp. carminata TaxID=160689 RepID=A0ABT1KD64_9ACTN|nr:radical SAM protein [Nonomuraea roseoviolacea]MCP2351943.1 DNA repair photolyase [Nonomuraea roseoviolacea subsp. carminata]